MSTAFRRERGGRVTASFEDVEVNVLRDLFGQLEQLLDDSAERPEPREFDGDGFDGDGSDDDRDAADADDSAAAAEGAGAAADGTPSAAQLREMVGDLGPRAAPDDPALARLLPDAYADDTEAAWDFRRYTEPGLRTGKITAARTAAGTLRDGGGRISLDHEQATAWLGALNDLRLTLGARLEVTEDHEATFGALDDTDPRKQLWYVYDWLSFLQQSLVESLLR